MSTAVQERYAPQMRCFGCGPANDKGLRIKSFPDGKGGLITHWRCEPHHEAFPGMLAGGIIGTLLDCHSNWTACCHLMENAKADKPPVTVTADYHVQLLKPVPTDREVVVRSRVLESTERRAKVEATLEVDGVVCASCTGNFVAVKPDHVAFHRW